MSALTEPRIDSFLAELRKRLVAAKDVAVTMQAGMTEIEDWESGWLKHEPNATLSVQLHINGGARNDKAVKR